MNLGFGRSYLAIPGPSVVPDRVLRAMHRASPNIYGGALVEMAETIYPDLNAVARSSGKVAIYIGNGHAVWEASLSNILSRGDRVLVPATGNFGLGFAEAAQGLGADVSVIDFGRRAAIDMNRLEEALKSDRGHQIKAVLAVHTDTATSVRNDIAAMRGVLDALGHPALLVVDCIASLACDRFEMDSWGADVMISASQKGLMMPPGLGFVWFNDRADAQHRNADLVTPYWDWTSRTDGGDFWRKFHGTPPAQQLYGLRESLDMILHEEGLENVWQRHHALANAVWAALEAWGQGGLIEMNIADPAIRSHAVTTVRIGVDHGPALRRWVEENAGVTLGIGLGMATDEDPGSDGVFRIAHMGHVNAHMVLGVLGVIDAGLKALGIPHGSGAVERAAELIAGV